MTAYARQIHFVRINGLYHSLTWRKIVISEPVFTYSKSTIETLEQGTKYVQS